MQSAPRPSQWVLRKASELGAVMAKVEKRITPYLDAAHTFANYLQFIQAHRHRIELLREFTSWDARLISLIEQEEKMTGQLAQDVEHWDEFHAQFATPIRCAFWYGWETAVQLRQQYEARVEEARRKEQTILIVRAAGAPDAPQLAEVSKDVAAEETPVQHVPGSVLNEADIEHSTANKL